ncbi:hypothetical protein DA803_02025 [[Mycoplasma] phocae]|uniref:Uncharacterized protein n=1 Tax=[Mycoplasma] phocae TaxID=142651 RepID=A0A2Z5IR43_9BACT|nr:hypothetical protein [[Mycoplasma] phocae]AXE60861.1 hypothetical protein DA803_02025 [[Mycoplasma] phocae]
MSSIKTITNVKVESDKFKFKLSSERKVVEGGVFNVIIKKVDTTTPSNSRDSIIISEPIIFNKDTNEYEAKFRRRNNKTNIKSKIYLLGIAVTTESGKNTATI